MKKTVAPIIIVVIILAYLAGITALVVAEPDMTDIDFGKIILIIVVTLVSGALIAVLVQRIREIRRGEEDDLSKY